MRLRARVALLVVSGVASCADPEPSWLDVARVEVAALRPDGALAPGVRVVREGERAWLVATLERAAWKAQGEPGRFTTSLPVFAVGAPPSGELHYRLLAGGRALRFEPDPARFGAEPGVFTTDAAHALALHLALLPDEAPPAEAELWACLDYEHVEDGARYVGGRRLSGAGLWVPGGTTRALSLTLPPAARLTFATTLEPLLGAREPRTAPHTFRVRLDGALLFERVVQPDLLGEAIEWQSVELPRGGVQKARLEFECEGPFALSAFLAPRIGPREIGSYAERPAELRAGRPDLVVFLADTFRADNLAAYGSSLGLTPEIDRFAGEARTFVHTWSTSTHTLPVHSSLFSGVFPHQNGQVDFDNPLPGEVETLAERLSARGYRCGLISDGVMVSRVHGLGQGFEVFDERREAGTVERARAFLDADDGRPIFLFAQTYAVHTPYRMSAETHARWNGTLRLDRSYEEVMATELMRAEKPLAEEAPPGDPEVAEIAARLRDLYRAGVTELDALFGRFRSELDAHALLAHGCFVFTSDHGEAFFEHGRPFHANRVFEEELRVPLLVKVPGLAPGRDERPVSLIDFAPTLAGLAGLAVPAQWPGRSWLAPAERRVLFAFQSNRSMEGSTLAVIDAAHKLIGYDDLAALRAGKLHAAFDLSADPAELQSLLASEGWPAELAAAQRAELEKLLTPLVAPEKSHLTPEQLQGLRDMGYAGEAGEEERGEPRRE